ncbi:MAG: hypothetical protein RLZZ234_291 [Candidatus Parcubacteria bacterium]
MSEGFKQRIDTAITHAGEDSLTDEAKLGDREAVQSIAGPDAWATMETVQEEKRALMHEMMEWRKKFWDSEGAHKDERTASLSRIAAFEQGEGGRTLRVRPDGMYEALQKGGEVTILTKGEVYAAHEWGTWWKFDDTVSREQQLGIMSHQVRNLIAEKYDAQLLAFGKADRLSDDRKRDTYARIEATQGSMETMPNGILAEKMLLSFLTKAMHDRGLTFTVERADVHADVEYKIDFKIIVQDTKRGVRVGEPEHRIGIQFTLNPDAVGKKTEQLTRAQKRLNETDVDELILVTMPIDDVRKNFDRWRYDDQGNKKSEKRLDPRGPDMYWSKETQERILDGIVRRVA